MDMRKNRLFQRVFALLLCGLTLPPLAGCGAGKTAAQTRTVFAMDTVMTLTAHGKNADAALESAESELYRLDALLARGVEGSAVYRLNHDGFVRDGDVSYLLFRAQRISEATGGAFDVTVAPLLELWGFGSGAGEHRVPTEAEIAAALEHVGMERVHREGDTGATLDLPAQVDLGGIAKGYAAWNVCKLLSGAGVTGAVLDLGGDVALLGSKPDGSDWRVAIKDPNGGDFLGILGVSDAFVMTSGVYERYFEENSSFYHHIIDPKTGYPADSGLMSATVICGDGVWADALATAVCVMGAERALALRGALDVGFDLILVTGDGRVLYTCEDFTPGTGNGYVYEQVS